MDPDSHRDRLIVIGEGADDLEDGLVLVARMVGYETVVIDKLSVLSQKPDSQLGDYDLERFSFDPSDSVVVVTHNQRDVPILEALSRKRVGFVGFMGDRQRGRETIGRLREMGVAQSFLDSIHTPVGVDIGSVSAEEISLSVVAELVAMRHGIHFPHKGRPQGAAEGDGAPLAK
ncbi:MAG: XdhC family protein [Nitrososphaerales archaeon]